MFVCWSVKGGSGTTVVAAALALVLARSRPVVLADLGGDLPAALGLPEPSGPGLLDWMASPTADVAALTRLATTVTDSVQLLPSGARADIPPPHRWSDLSAALVAFPTVVVDAGSGCPPAELLATADQSLLVLRPCYLALRRAVACATRPSGIVVVTEPGRALAARDIERALDIPVVAEVPYDPAVSRAVDAGILAGRLPRSITQPLADAA
jgi:MinD superfamily P-loop ATPase